MAAMAAPGPQATTSVKEETLWRGTPSSSLLFGKISILFISVIALLLIYYFGYQFLAPYATVAWIVIAVVVIWQIAAILIALARIKSTLYTISTQRVMIETGLTTKKVEDIDLRYIDDTQFSQTVWERILGIGDVTIVSSDKVAPKYSLLGVRDPRGLRELIRANAYAVSQRQLFTRAT